MLVDLQVIIQVHFGLFPTGKDKGLGGQGLQCRLVHLLKEGTTGAAIAFHHPMIEAFQALSNRGIEVGKTGETLMAQRSNNLTFHFLYRFFPPWDLSRGFLARAGKNGHLIVFGKGVDNSGSPPVRSGRGR